MVTVVNPYPVILSPSTQQTGTANLSGQIQGSVFKPGGLTGSTGISRYVGATASGAPISGTFAVGDYIIDRTGTIFICTTAGTPGTWTQVVGSATQSNEVTATDFKASGLTGATSASRYVGATVSGSPVSGTFAVGDFVIDQTGTIYICTVAGTPGTWVSLSRTLSRLNYVLASDLNPGLTANQFVDLSANQTFTVGSSTSVVTISVSGNCWGTGYVLASILGSRIVIDSAGTPITKQLGGNYQAASTYANLLAGSSPITFTGLSAGSHTIKVQLISNGGSSPDGTACGSAFCRPVTAPNWESLQIAVLEYPQ